MTTSRRRALQFPYSPDPVRVHMARAYTEFAGADQYALAYLFSQAQVGTGLTDGEHTPVVGDPRLGPVAIMDGLCRDYALLPEELTMLSEPFGICRVLDKFPRCEQCGEDAHYDLWASAFRIPSILCHGCAEFAHGVALGTGTATCLATFDELPWQIRDFCDSVTAELGRPSLWA